MTPGAFIPDATSACTHSPRASSHAIFCKERGWNTLVRTSPCTNHWQRMLPPISITSWIVIFGPPDRNRTTSPTSNRAIFHLRSISAQNARIHEDNGLIPMIPQIQEPRNFQGPGTGALGSTKSSKSRLLTDSPGLPCIAACALFYGLWLFYFLDKMTNRDNWLHTKLVPFDPRASAEGIENPRDKPPQQEGINLFRVPFFLIGSYSLLTRKARLWPLKYSVLYLSNLMFIQIPSAYAPNWARALSVVPTVYLCLGLGVEALWEKIPAASVKRHREKLIGGVVAISLLISITSFSTYWTWVRSPAFTEAQRPVVKVEELPTYLRLMKDRIENDGRIFLLHDWNNPSWREEHLSTTYWNSLVDRGR